VTGAGTACDRHRFNYWNEYMRVYMARYRDKKRLAEATRLAAIPLKE
jgi:hypothetical protein